MAMAWSAFSFLVVHSRLLTVVVVLVTVLVINLGLVREANELLRHKPVYRRILLLPVAA